MRVWEICYPDENNNTITECLTEKGILDQYYDYFSKKMLDMGKSPMITERNCIDNFVIVHWATEVK